MSDGGNSQKPDSNQSEALIPVIYFSNAVREVVRTMMGLEVNEVKAFSGLYEDVTEQVTSILPLTGDLNLMLSISLSKKSASAFVVYMTGMQYSEVKETDTNDCIAETVNMIAGYLKTQMASKGCHIKIEYPFVVSGDKYTITHKNKVENIIKRFRAGSLDFLFKVYFYHM